MCIIPIVQALLKVYNRTIDKGRYKAETKGNYTIKKITDLTPEQRNELEKVIIERLEKQKAAICANR